MENSKSKALSGEKNKRINNRDTRNSEITFPLADVKMTNQITGATMPSEEDVIHAKEWVDNGSRL